MIGGDVTFIFVDMTLYVTNVFTPLLSYEHLEAESKNLVQQGVGH